MAAQQWTSRKRSTRGSQNQTSRGEDLRRNHHNRLLAALSGLESPDAPCGRQHMRVCGLPSNVEEKRHVGAHEKPGEWASDYLATRITFANPSSRTVTG
jgi:hypothetical protein